MKKVLLISFILLLSSRPAGASDNAAAPPASAPVPGKVRFNRDIRPLLAENCFQCHGADASSRKAKLRLDREDGVLEKRPDGLVVARGKPEESLLYKHIVTADEDELMPPPESNKKLKPEERELFKQWIAQGAPWEAHWSFIKPERPDLPRVLNEKWTRSPIDRFILAKLEAAGLDPAPEADPRALARRVTLDLTGLPPEPDAVEAFAADKNPDAYEHLVDKLLASPHYGEHRARYWLDYCRYADTHGVHFDNFRDIWPYRDWIINAFNRNQPFDQFTVEQLAGDLLPNPTQEQLVATGFQRCNITTNEGGTIPAENLANYARDRVETTSWVFLGLTANCAVCHDHKFDPISTKDFYAMSAYYRNTTQSALDGNVRDTAPILLLPQGSDAKRWSEIPKELDAAQTAITERKKSRRMDFDTWLEQAAPKDWDMLGSAGAPAFHLPLCDEQPRNEDRSANETWGTFEGQPIVAKSAAALAWNDEGKIGKAPVLDGVKTPLEIAGGIGDFDKDQAFSYGCWLKTPKDFKGNGVAFARMDDTAGFRGWDLYVQDTEFGAHLSSKWDTDAIKVVTIGKQAKPGMWQHVFVTYDGSAKAEGFRIFVDGREAKLKIEKNTLAHTTKTDANFSVGRRKSQSGLRGLALQDLRIYARRVPAAEVQRLVAQPRLNVLLVKNIKALSFNERSELFDIYILADNEIAALNEKTATLEAEKKTIRERMSVAYIMEEKKNSTPTANILFRGAYDKPKEAVEPAVFAALHPLPAHAPGNRLGLAQWLVSPENPLMPRVIVNRYWQEIFGTGIVKTAEDFGVMGEPPSHPELLDWLAVKFRDGGWDVKQLIKSIVMSSTYRQSSTTTRAKLDKDPANRLLARGPRFRMDAEMIRDYALAASGLLSSKTGGPSVKPYQPEGVWDVVGMPESNTRNYKRDTGDSLYRRSMYTFWKRAAPPVSMDILNAPTRETACLRRERTDTPLQALVTLNDPQFVEAARVLAQHALEYSMDDDARMGYIAFRLLARPLSEKEIPIVKRELQELLEHYKSKPDDAKALLANGETKPDEKLSAAELAAWTMVCNQLLNLDEVLNK